MLALNSRAQVLMHSGLAMLQAANFWEDLPEAITDRYRGGAEKALRSDTRSAFVSGHALPKKANGERILTCLPRMKLVSKTAGWVWPLSNGWPSATAARSVPLRQIIAAPAF